MRAFCVIGGQVSPSLPSMSRRHHGCCLLDAGGSRWRSCIDATRYGAQVAIVSSKGLGIVGPYLQARQAGSWHGFASDVCASTKAVIGRTDLLWLTEK
jgi:hypothetical protein